MAILITSLFPQSAGAEWIPPEPEPVLQIGQFDELPLVATILEAERKVPPKSIEDIIREELGEQFINISRCESGLKQFNEDGSVLLSKTSDKGLFQINQVHWQTAKDLGIDINTIEGNIAYAKLLKEKNGTVDWKASKHCWNKI